jgi:hypothetical protein
MSALLEPPPLLAMLLLVGVAALTLWWGTASRTAHGRPGGNASSGASEESERWGADEAPLPQKAPYAYRPPAERAGSVEPAPAPTPGAPAPHPASPAIRSRATAAASSQASSVAPEPHLTAPPPPQPAPADRGALPADTAPEPSTGGDTDREDGSAPSQPQQLEVSLAGFFPGSARTQRRPGSGASAGDVRPRAEDENNEEPRGARPPADGQPGAPVST